MSGLIEDIHAFVAELMGTHVPQLPVSPKVIHDPIWGTQRYFPHEMAIIDCPVLQRLRRIYQTGYSLFTFPSTTQTRFEHSLGAAAVSLRIIEAVAERHPSVMDLDPITGDVAQ